MPISEGLLKRIKENDPALRYLNLSGQGLTDDDIPPLVTALKTNTYLTAISLYSTKYPMPQENPNPNVIYLPSDTPHRLHNKLTATSAKLLAGCNRLRWLNISGNSIGDEGAIALAQSTSLIELHAVACQIKIAGAQAFLANQVLHELWLMQNNFDQYEGGEDADDANSWINRIDRRLEDNKAKKDEKTQLELTKKRADLALEKQILAAMDTEDITQLKVLILQLKHGVHTRLAYGCSVSQYAVDKTKLNAVRWLLSIGALIEAHEREYTPLFTAAEKGDYELVRILLCHGSNMTGEFYFNDETALSIALFKANTAFRRFLHAHPNLGLPPQPTKELGEFIREWDAFANDSKDDVPAWVRAGSAPFEILKNTRLVYKYINLFFNPKFSSANDTLRSDKNFQIAANYIRIYQLLHDKHAVINKRDLLHPTKYFQEIEDEKGLMPYQLEVLPLLQGKKWQSTDRQTVNSAVDKLNAELKQNKELDIKWADHPRFFIAQYRCIHYYTHLFDDNQRRDHIATRHLNRIMPAPAVFAMSSITPQAHQLMRETQVAHDRADLIEKFEGFRQSGEIKLRNKTFANADAALQEKFSNDYRGSIDDIKRKANVPNEILFDQKAIGYPHCATSDLPQHTLRYGFGKKLVGGLASHRLKPEYDEKGKPKHIFLGKIYIALFSPLEMAQHRARHILGAHNRELVNLYDTVAPERETGLPGGALAGQFFYEAVLEVPDLSAWSSSHVEKFGLQQTAFNDYQKRLASAKTAIEREKITDDLLSHLINFKEKELLNIAQQEAQRRGGILIYRHYDREYGLEPEKIRASDRPPYVSQIERALMAATGAQRFKKTTGAKQTNANAGSGSAPMDIESNPSDEVKSGKLQPPRQPLSILHMRPAKRARTEYSGSLSTRNTKGFGDCALHASLGVDNGTEYECKNVLQQREKLARAVRECKPGDEIYQIAEKGIEALMMGSEREIGQHIKQLRLAYQTHVLDRGADLDVAWLAFEYHLSQHENIVEHINAHVAAEEKRNPNPQRNLSTLRAKFNFCLHIKYDKAGETLDALIQSTLELNEAFQTYNNEAKRGFNLAVRINANAIEDYAQFVGKPGQWLLPHELELIARVNNIAIKLYTVNDDHEPFTLIHTYNSGAGSVVAIRLDGGHYERVNDVSLQPVARHFSLSR